MEFLVCIDDTDTIDSIGTGTICEYIRDSLIENSLAECAMITRHQLLIHEDIPYTSHNSSMCFTGRLINGEKQDIIDTAINLVKQYHANGSDPGVAVAFINEVTHVTDLINFGIRATSEVLNKEVAYDLATKYNIHLSEHGGTGQGVIGALAGIGLRMSGQYGELKGVLKKVQDVTFLVSELKHNHRIDRVVTTEGQELDDNQKVYIEKQTKAMMKDNQHTLLVYAKDDYYIAIDRAKIRAFQVGRDLTKKRFRCNLFKTDVEEERIDNQEMTCFNCTYRRWEMKGISCNYTLH